MISNTISENRSSDGGGIRQWSGGGYSLYSVGATVVKGNIIRDNYASSEGGGISINFSSPSAFLQNLVAGNRAYRGAAIYGGTGSNTFVNNTIANNDSSTGASAVTEATFYNNIVASGSDKPALSRSRVGAFSDNIVYSAAGSAYGIGGDRNGIDGNVTADPRLSGPQLGYFGLLPGSPAIDAGETNAALPSTDLAGSARVLDGNADGTSAIDIGAYEFDGGAPCAQMQGIPTDQLKADALTLAVGGTGVVSYRYSLDGGPFSSDIAVAAPIALASLSDGRHSIAVLGKDEAGREQQMASPSTGTWLINTEASDLSFTFGGDAPWFIQADVSRDGLAYQSGAVGSSQSSWMETTVTGPGAIRFWWKMPTSYYDSSTTFTMDGVTKGSTYGNQGWQFNVYPVASGKHTLRWTFAVQYATVPPSAAWVDGITFTPGANLDISPPSTTATPNGGTYSASQNVSLSCTDNVACSGTLYCLGDGCDPSVPYTGPIAIDSTTALRFYSTDSAGNAEGVQSKSFIFDRTAPTTFASPSEGSYSGARDVTLGCSDYSMGCAATYWCAGTDCTPSALYTAPVPVTASTVLRYYSVDTGGNTEQVRTSVYTILPDATPPATSAFPPAGAYGATTVYLFCNDGDGSGCGKTYYCLGAQCDPATPAGAWVPLTASTDLRYYSVDRSGNSEGVQTVSYTIDAQAPTTTASEPGGVYTGPRQVSLTCDDGTGSGCSSTYYCFGTSCNPDILYSGPLTISSTGYLRFSSVDAVGNWEQTKSSRYTIASAAPVTRNVPGDYPTIQGAIDAAGEGDTVLVAPGTYLENIDFKGKAITVKGSGGPQATIIDGGGRRSVAVFASGEWTTSVLTGFTLRNGATTWGYGGGIYISNASPSIIDNVITGNHAYGGAGIYASGDAVIRNNTITANSQQDSSGGNGGGGIYLSSGSCQVLDNVIADNGISQAPGGGIYVEGWGSHTIRGNVIRNNGGEGVSGGGVYFGYAPGTDLIQNVIVGNRALAGGGVSVNRSGRIVNNTMSDNDAPHGSALYLSSYGAAGDVVNNILSGKGGEPVLESDTGATLPLLSHNVLFSPSGDLYAGGYTGYSGEGNTIGDPLLAGARFGYYGIMPGSAAIDAGDTSVAGLPATDMTGAPRVLAGSTGGSAVVDAGAFEFNPAEPRAVVTGAPPAATRETGATLTVGGAGIVSYRFAVDGGAESADAIPVSTPVVLAGLSSGSHVVAVTGIAADGTQRAAAATVAQWNVDATPPVTTASPGSGTFSGPQSVTLSCDDNFGSGCTATFYCLGAECTPSTPYSGPFTVSSPTGIRYFSRDAFGFEEAVKSSSYSFVGSVSGRVTDSVTGAAIPIVYVAAYDVATGAYRQGGYTDDSGRYTLGQLPFGGYKLQFSASGYLTTWYGGAADRAASQTVQVSAPGATSGIGLSLVLGGGISGAVIDSETKAPLPAVYVTVSGGGHFYTSMTDASGGYLVSGLPTGSYTVHFSPYDSDYLAGDFGAAVSVAAPGVTGGIDYELKKGGRITGTVTDSGGTPLAGATVCAIDPVSGGAKAYVSTDSSGKYTIRGVTGSYHLSFFASGYVTTWYGGSFTEKGAIAVSVTASAVTSGIDISLPSGGQISGRVTVGTGAGVPGISVTAYWASTGSSAGAAYTDSTGTYTIQGLATGTYKIRFSSYGYLNQWSGGVADQASAAQIAVTAPSIVSGVDAVLVPAGSISGTVTDNETGTFLAGINLAAYAADGSIAGTGRSDGNGRYSIGWLPMGTYTVKALASLAYCESWYADPGTSAAKGVAVTASFFAVDGINLAVQKGAVITGTITESVTGQPIKDSWVTAYDAVTNRQLAWVYSDESGRYTLSALPTGSYKLHFEGSGFIPQWSGGKETQAAAAAVSVTAPNTTGGVDAVLSKGGSITGTVSDAGTGVAVPGAFLTALSSSAEYWGSGYSDANGRFTIAGLASGSYRVRIDAPDGTSYLSGWYGGSCADTVAVSAPGAVTGIDMLLQMGGSISGRITDAVSGAGISGVTLSWNGGDGAASSISPLVDDTGSYTIPALRPGSYRITFRATGYITKTDVVATVTGSEPVTGIDAALTPGGSIGGRITDSDTGSGISGVVVRAVEKSSGAPVSTAHSDYLGNYVVGGLATGSYRLVLDGRSGRTGYGNSTYDPSGGIAVTAPGSVAGVSLSLTREGAVAGTVIDDATGAPLQGIPVVAHDGTGFAVATDFSDSYGRFSMQLPSGSYRFEFIPQDDGDGGYLGRWYPDKSLPAIAVEAPTAVQLAAARLSKGGGITGEISVNSCPAPPTITIAAYDADNGKVVRTTAISPDYGGFFSLGALPTGIYKVLAQPQGAGFVGQWYPGTNDFASASAVSVTEGSVTPGISILLPSGGASVSGAVCPAWHGAVQLYDWYSGGLVTQGRASAGGFLFNGVPDGTYKVLFSVGTEGRWYVAPNDTGMASPVVVSGGVAVGGIDMNQGCPDGVAGMKQPTLTDALAALRMVVGVDPSTPERVARYDVAPVTGGVSVPDGTVGIGDVVLLLRMAVGLPVLTDSTSDVSAPAASATGGNYPPGDGGIIVTSGGAFTLGNSMGYSSGSVSGGGGTSYLTGQ